LFCAQSPSQAALSLLIAGFLDMRHCFLPDLVQYHCILGIFCGYFLHIFSSRNSFSTFSACVFAFLRVVVDVVFDLGVVVVIKAEGIVDLSQGETMDAGYFFRVFAGLK
jgi:hypothetical protein